LVPFLLTSSAAGASSAPRVDPKTGRVRVLFLGEVASTNWLFLRWINADPQFIMTRVPLDIEWISMAEAKRFARIYLPRSEQAVRSGYDVLVFEDFTPVVMQVAVLDWFQSCISQGMGIALIEYVYWGGLGAGTNEIGKWTVMDFYQVFPADVVMNDFPASQGRAFYQVRNPEGPLNLPGLESVPLNRGHHGDMIPRPGSVVEAVWSGSQTPCMVTGTYGEGHTLQLGQGWDNIPDETRLHYAYLIDYIFNQIFCIADLPYPKDLAFVHTVRKMFATYQDRRVAAIDLLEFVERFGANPTKAVGLLDAMETDHETAMKLYLAGQYDGARDELADLLDKFGKVDDELLEARNRALFWVYAAEWVTVSAVTMVCGSLLWVLMVRRRFYREVAVTRAS